MFGEFYLFYLLITLFKIFIFTESSLSLLFSLLKQLFKFFWLDSFFTIQINFFFYRIDLLSRKHFCYVSNPGQNTK